MLAAPSNSVCREGWQFGDVRRDAPRPIESQRLGDPGIAQISVAVDIGEGLLVGIHHLVAAV